MLSIRLTWTCLTQRVMESILQDKSKIDTSFLRPDSAEMLHVDIWKFEDAPERLRAICDQGGDEDFIIFVPSCLSEKSKNFFKWSLIEKIRICDVAAIETSFGTFYITSHA